MLEYQHILRRKSDKIAEAILIENGKAFPDCKGDVFRGLEMVEHACGISHVQMGETFENIAKSIDCYSYRVPLGVVAGVCPFNFPAMIPLWMFPFAITCGNTMVIKPSEKVPRATMLLAQIAQEIGLPKGVLNIVNGGFDTTKQICKHPKIKAISFVGGNRAGDYIYETGAKHHKRMQCNMGAKNHCVIMPDADKTDALNAVVGASFGATGQRCMALPVAIFVGKSKEWVSDLVAKAKTLKVTAGIEKDCDVGPLCYPELK